MKNIDRILDANAEYAEHFHDGTLATPPSRKLVVLCCMDSRIALFSVLDLKLGEAHLLRNAGGVVTDDVLRSLIISHHRLGTEELLIINHTQCGLLGITDTGLREELERKTGTPAPSPATFHAFTDLEENVRRQMRLVTTHPWLRDMAVAGAVYEVETGLLRPVTP